MIRPAPVDLSRRHVGESYFRIIHIHGKAHSSTPIGRRTGASCLIFSASQPIRSPVKVGEPPIEAGYLPGPRLLLDFLLLAQKFFWLRWKLASAYDCKNAEYDEHGIDLSTIVDFRVSNVINKRENEQH